MICIILFSNRFINGVADAAALGAVISILMKLFPKYVTTVISWTEMLFGLGYMLGKTRLVYNLWNNFWFFSTGFKRKLKIRFLIDRNKNKIKPRLTANLCEYFVSIHAQHKIRVIQLIIVLRWFYIQ